MASTGEAVILALVALVEAALPTADVRRNGDLPDKPGPGGLVIVRDGDRGEPEVSFSPLRYTWSHAIQLEIVGLAAGDGRFAGLDDMLSALGLAIEQDRTLGGLCDWLEPGAPDTDDINPAGTQPLRWAALDVVAVYVSANALT